MSGNFVSVAEGAARLGIGRLAMLHVYRRGEVAGQVAQERLPGGRVGPVVRLHVDSFEEYRARHVRDPDEHRMRIAAERRIERYELARECRQAVAKARQTATDSDGMTDVRMRQEQARRIEADVAAKLARIEAKRARSQPTIPARPSRPVYPRQSTRNRWLGYELLSDYLRKLGLRVEYRRPS